MPNEHSPYLEFPREAWAAFRRDTPLTVTEAELLQLQGQNAPVSMDEVVDIYLPLSRLLNLYVAATQDLYRVTTRFLGHPEPRVPYIIGVAGSVAVGKSTTSRLLQALLSRWPNHPRVEIITTDGYLYPTAVLQKKGLLARKGFPESYNQGALLQFLIDLKAGVKTLRVPLYSHHYYDTLDTYQTIEQPDIVIVEGLNVMQVGAPQSGKTSRLFVSDFFDFSIYVDAPTDIIAAWYLDRFALFRQRATDDPAAFFHQFSKMSDAEAQAFAKDVWVQTNQVNLLENILPFRERARLILEKSANHAVQRVKLRKI